MPVVAQFIILALAVARLSGLVAVDGITDGLRTRILGGLDDRPATFGAFLTYLFTCQWCISMYIALPWVIAHFAWPGSPWVQLPAQVLAISQITGMLSQAGR